MESVSVQQSVLQGSVCIPSSKSHTHRGFLYATIATGESHLYNLLESPDTQAMINACSALGAQITRTEKCWKVIGTGGNFKKTTEPLDVGNSGIALRFLTAISAMSHHPITITGDASVQKRPMLHLIEALKGLGATITSSNGNAPLTVSGPIAQFETSVVGHDSQHVSALLSLGILQKEPLTITVTNPGEKPWVDLTLYWLDRLNVPFTRNGYTQYTIQGNGSIQGFNYTAPGDFSSAAFPIAAALITRSEITLEGLDPNDPQGDKALIPILQSMQADIEWQGEQLKVRPSQLKGISIDINDCIDVLPILATIACYTEGTTQIYGASVAKEKECDRIACIAKELRKLGASIEEKEDGLEINGSKIFGATVESHDDHRIAMALIVAGLGAKGKTTVLNTLCIAKTYPNFLKDIKRIGGNINIV